MQLTDNMRKVLLAFDKIREWPVTDGELMEASGLDFDPFSDALTALWDRGLVDTHSTEMGSLSDVAMTRKGWFLFRKLRDELGTSDNQGI